MVCSISSLHGHPTCSDALGCFLSFFTCTNMLYGDKQNDPESEKSCIFLEIVRCCRLEVSFCSGIEGFLVSILYVGCWNDCGRFEEHVEAKTTKVCVENGGVKSCTGITVRMCAYL